MRQIAYNSGFDRILSIMDLSYAAKPMIEVVLDSGLSQGNPHTSKSMAQNNVRERFLIPLVGTYPLIVQPFLKATGQHKISLPNNRPMALWISSSDNQPSYEDKINGSTRGIFTYNFCKAIRYNMNQNREELCNVTNKYIEKTGFDQKVLLQSSSELILDAPFDYQVDPFVPPGR